MLRCGKHLRETFPKRSERQVAEEIPLIARQAEVIGARSAKMLGRRERDRAGRQRIEGTHRVTCQKDPSEGETREPGNRSSPVRTAPLKKSTLRGTRAVRSSLFDSENQTHIFSSVYFATIHFFILFNNFFFFIFQIWLSVVSCHFMRVAGGSRVSRGTSSSILTQNNRAPDSSS